MFIYWRSLATYKMLIIKSYFFERTEKVIFVDLPLKLPVLKLHSTIIDFLILVVHYLLNAPIACYERCVLAISTGVPIDGRPVALF